MRIGRFAGTWGLVVFCLTLLVGGMAGAQNKTAAPSITVYQDPT